MVWQQDLRWPLYRRHDQHELRQKRGGDDDEKPIGYAHWPKPLCPHFLLPCVIWQRPVFDPPVSAGQSGHSWKQI